LHQQLEDAAQLLEDRFNSTSIADLLDVPGPNKPLCRFPGTSETAAELPSEEQVPE
jgi:hypothetical protein